VLDKDVEQFSRRRRVRPPKSPGHTGNFTRGVSELTHASLINNPRKDRCGFSGRVGTTHQVPCRGPRWFHEVITHDELRRFLDPGRGVVIFG